MDEDDRRVARFYGKLLSEHGRSHRALDWTTPNSQTQRFDALLKGGVTNGDSVLDVGCGLGDLLPFLENRGLRVNYTGIDMTPELIGACQKEYPDSTFMTCNLMDRTAPFGPNAFDWVFASGIFAHRKEDPWGYMKDSIRRMVEFGRKGVAFNSLSGLLDRPEKWSLFHADPQATRLFCQDLRLPCTLIHNAEQTDFTVYIWRSRAYARKSGLPFFG